MVKSTKIRNELNIRSLYRPVQPTVKHAAKCVVYKEVSPEARLSNIIYCYWELKTNERLQDPFTYKVVADGCIDIFFRLDDPSENYLMGFCKKYTEFPLDNYFHYIGIRFLPTKFPALFKVNAKELSDRFERLDVVLNETSKYITEHFSDRDDFAFIKFKLDNYFTGLIHNSPADLDTRFQNALNIILKNFGAVNIESGLDTGLSQRQLRRYFEFYIGDTAKTFSQIVRFQNVLNARPSSQSLGKSKLFFDMGYYDQAHFIKEFKNFYGVTPGKAFGG
ncbi:MAG: AraC family transcriptional regulator [Cyclobacteriaceae bacterium]|nr:AraC family transcriptional regulator [Cyclobacteriaceae bacterium]